MFAFCLLAIPLADLQVAQKADQAGEIGRLADSVIQAEMPRQHIPGAAFVFVKDGRVVYQKGYGYADVERRRPVDPVRTVWRIGSVTKTFTATAVMQLVDRGMVNLDADANRYLKSVKVPGGYPLPVTVGDLLTHSGGLDEIRPGTQADTRDGILPLADFLRPRLVRVRAPGRSIAYSTYGITLAGLLVQDVTGSSYETFVTENIFRPLEMSRSSITNVPDSLADAIARGYEMEGTSLVPQPWEWYHSVPASSINSTAADMARYLMAHLAASRSERSRLLSPAAGAKMHQQRLTMHPLSPGVTLGWWEDFVGDLRVVDHGGNMAGYSSQLTMIPSENAGFFLVNQIEGSTLRDVLKRALLERLYPQARVRKPVPPAPPGWADRSSVYAGRYFATTSCFSCRPVRPSADVELKADTSALLLFGKRWIETEPLVFVREDGASYLTFQADSSGRVTGMSAGSFWTLDKVPSKTLHD